MTAGLTGTGSPSIEKLLQTAPAFYYTSFLLVCHLNCICLHYNHTPRMSFQNDLSHFSTGLFSGPPLEVATIAKAAGSVASAWTPRSTHAINPHTHHIHPSLMNSRNNHSAGPCPYCACVFIHQTGPDRPVLPTPTFYTHYLK